jgi:preprotein translocase subunit SecF
MSGITRLYRGENDYNFTKLWRWGVRLSTVLFIVSILSLATRGLNLGIDFEGGLSWQVKAPGVTVEQARGVLTPLGLGEAKVQVIGSDVLRVQAPADSAEKEAAVANALGGLAGVPGSAVNIDNVGPTWGGEVTTSAVRALVVFLLAILAYVTLTFRGEWKLAVGVVVAVIHDVVISVGVYSIFQFEVTPATVIAFLTILGYSIYDTVVVYDKVQENAGRVGITSRMTYADMMNMSMNQVLLRSINTSVVAVLPVLSTLIIGAFILGAITLEEFAIALTVGLTIGAYSSIFVAAPVVVWMKEREPRNRQLRERLAATSSRAAGAGAAADAPSGEGSGTPTVAARSGGPAVDVTAYSRNHPPRPRKQGKKR